MKFTPEDTKALHEKLTGPIALELHTPLLEAVMQLIPYEIRYPEESAAMDKAIAHIEPPPIHYGHDIPKISDEHYQRLLRLLTNIDKLARCGHVSAMYEDMFEKEVRKCRKTLVRMLEFYLSEQLEATQALHISRMKAEIARELDPSWREHMDEETRKQASTEENREYLLRSKRETCLMRTKNIHENYSACLSMLELFEDLQTLISNHRTLPAQASLG